MSTIDAIAHEAQDLFVKRDAVERELRDIDNRVRALRAAYMEEARIWGISLEHFRQETRNKVAA